MTLTAHELQSRRKFPRRHFRRAVALLYNGEYNVGVGSEIGEGGLSFILPKEHPMSSQGVVSFQIPDGSFICVRVELRNLQDLGTDGFLIGCAFQNLKFEHRREIRSYVSSRSNSE